MLLENCSPLSEWILALLELLPRREILCVGLRRDVFHRIEQELGPRGLPGVLAHPDADCAERVAEN